MTVLAGQTLVWISALAGVVAVLLASRPRAQVVACLGQAVALVLATALLLVALARDDFSVRYVALTGSRAAPLTVKLSALWAGMDGSLLFFVTLAACVVALAAWAERGLAVSAMALPNVVLVVLVAAGASPFHAMEPAPPDGLGVAPLLQNHWLMLVHPPALYLGAVTTLPLWGLGVAGLRSGAVSTALRRWALVSFFFSSAGILLGAWWAYAVLGWGGYWAWDPVENVSLLPWLATVALLHLLAVHERRGAGARACLVLATVPFALVVLGTFVTRSGVVSSVHAFARSRLGPVFLALLLGLVAATVIALLRGSRPSERSGERGLSLASRGGALVAGVLTLLFLAAFVLIGTLAPTVIGALGGGTVAVAPPFYNRAAAAFALVLLVLMAAGTAIPWSASRGRELLSRLSTPLSAAAATALLCGVAFGLGLATLVFALGALAAVAAVQRLGLPALRKRAALARREGAAARRTLGAAFAHLGVVVLLVGVAASSAFVTTASATAAPGESFALGAYRVRFEGLVTREEPHRRWVAAELTLTRPDGFEQRVPAESGPRLTFYPRRETPVSSPAVRADGLKDLYVSLGGFDATTQAAGFVASVFPLVNLVWGALPLLLLGALLCLRSR